MFSHNSRKNLHDLVDFLPPKRHEGKNSYIDFWMRDPATGKMKRKKIMLDRFKPGRERDLVASQIIANIWNKAMTGWNCWNEVTTTREDVKFTDIINKYRAYINNMTKKGVMSEKTLYDYNSRLKILEEYVDDRMVPNMRMYQFDLLCVTDFLDYVLLDRETSTRTRNNYRTWLSAFCTWLVERKYISENFISKIPTLPEKTKFREALPAEALKRLADHLRTNDPKFLLACMMEYYTFIRPIELTKIKIGDISIKDQTVFVAAQISKNRRDGLVALNDEIVKLMIDLNVFSYPSNYYLFGKKLSPSENKASYNLFRQKFLAVRKELNFPDSYMFYSLKDSGIRDLANTQGIVVAKEQARHSDVSVTNHYLVGRDRKVNEETKHFKGYL